MCGPFVSDYEPSYTAPAVKPTRAKRVVKTVKKAVKKVVKKISRKSK